MTKTRRNNKSRFFKDWTTKKLKEQAIGYHQTIYQIECYGVRDLVAYDRIMAELRNRGVEPDNSLRF